MMKTDCLSTPNKALSILLSLVLLFTAVACNQNTIAAYAQIIGNAGATLASTLGNTALAAKLQTDTADFVTAVKAWKQGTPCQNIQQLATVLLADFNDITATFGTTVPPNIKALIDLAVVTLLALLPLMPGCAPPAGLKAPSGVSPAKDAKEFKARWNAIAAQSPQTAGAVIK
jgi:hypothetical protein